VPIVGTGTHRGEYSDPPGESPSGKRDDKSAGRVQPLQVVYSDQQWRLTGKGYDDRKKAGCHRPLIRGLARSISPQQDQIDRVTLRGRQIGELVGADVAQHVGQRAVCEYGLCWGRPSRQHPNPVFAGLADSVRPQGRLTDTRFALNHQCRRPARDRGQQVGNGTSFGLTTYIGGTHRRTTSLGEFGEAMAVAQDITRIDTRRSEPVEQHMSPLSVC